MTNLCLPRGNKTGANSEWIPGGFTSTGNSEAVIAPIPWASISESQVKIIVK